MYTEQGGNGTVSHRCYSYLYNNFILASRYYIVYSVYIFQCYVSETKTEYLLNTWVSVCRKDRLTKNDPTIYIFGKMGAARIIYMGVILIGGNMEPL